MEYKASLKRSMITSTNILISQKEKKKAISWNSLVNLILKPKFSTGNFLGRQREWQELQWFGKQNRKFQMAQTECRVFAGFFTWPIRQSLEYTYTCGYTFVDFWLTPYEGIPHLRCIKALFPCWAYVVAQVGDNLAQ